MRARFPVLLVLVCVLTLVGSAQERGSLSITVTDTTGGVLPGVAVALSGPEAHQCVTDERGECRFATLAAGSYQIRTVLPGFVATTDTVTVNAAQPAQTTLRMPVAAMQETVTVSASSPLIDTHQTGRRGASEIVVTASRLAPAVDDERYSDAGENAFTTVTAAPLSTFSIDVDTASYANLRRFLNEGALPPREALRVEELINYFHFDYPQPSSDRPFSVTTEYAECPWNTTHRLALIGLQGRVIAERDLPPRNLVFLVDVSGSMDEPNKLPLVKHGLRMLAEQLTAADTLAIVVYAGSSGVALPVTRGDRKDRIARAIDDLEAGGSTNGAEGIRLAYRLARGSFIKGGVNRVVLATDGDFNVGVTNLDELVRVIEHERASGVALSVLGVGTGNIKDDTMEQLADKGNGNYAYLDTLYEAHRVLVKEAGSTLVTIAKDVKIQVEFNPAAVAGYRLIGYENRRLRDEDFNDDRKDAGDIGAGHSVTAIYEIVPAGVDMAPRIDPLKYTAAPPAAVRLPATTNGELLTVKLRYKQPDGEISQLTSVVVSDRVQPMGANLGFASAVAEAGMLLRGSSHVPKSSLAAALGRARKFRGADPDGYRAEFIRLMELASSLKKRERPTR